VIQRGVALNNTLDKTQATSFCTGHYQSQQLFLLPYLQCLSIRYSDEWGSWLVRAIVYLGRGTSLRQLRKVDTQDLRPEPHRFPSALVCTLQRLNHRCPFVCAWHIPNNKQIRPGARCDSASSERKSLCICSFLLLSVVIALYWAIRRVCLHDVSLMHTCMKSACRAEEGIPGQHT
jgi:hypothetical protein